MYQGELVQARSFSKAKMVENPGVFSDIYFEELLMLINKFMEDDVTGVFSRRSALR